MLMLNDYCSAVNCQNRRKNCLSKSVWFAFQCKQLQTSSAVARGPPRSAYSRGNST